MCALLGGWLSIGCTWQVHRIHDLMDINMLRLAKEGVDGTYKTMVSPASLMLLP